MAETYNREKEDSVPEQNRHVTAVIRYMYRHLDENLSLGTLAEEFELSKSYLNLIFQKATGHTPMDFFQELKMKEACKLLRSTELYIYQVGQRLGYQVTFRGSSGRWSGYRRRSIGRRGKYKFLAKRIYKHIKKNNYI